MYSCFTMLCSFLQSESATCIQVSIPLLSITDKVSVLYSLLSLVICFIYSVTKRCAGDTAACSKANKHARQTERKLSFILDASNWGGGGEGRHLSKSWLPPWQPMGQDLSQTDVGGVMAKCTRSAVSSNVVLVSSVVSDSVQPQGL